MIETLVKQGWFFGSCDISIENFQEKISTFTGMNYSQQRIILTPNKVSTAKLSLSKIYGLNAYPFHTDGVQHKIPPRYILLLDKNEVQNKTKTILKDGLTMASLNKPLFYNSIFQIKGNGFRELSPIVSTRKVKGHSIFRYNPVIMDSVIKTKKVDINQAIEDTRGIEIAWFPKGLLAIDNWRMLHSREAINHFGKSRTIERIEFYIT